MFDKTADAEGAVLEEQRNGSPVGGHLLFAHATARETEVENFRVACAPTFGIGQEHDYGRCFGDLRLVHRNVLQELFDLGVAYDDEVPRLKIEAARSGIRELKQL